MDVNRNIRDGHDEQLSLHQLQSAIADISKALNEALRDDRINAVMYLQRAESFLKVPALAEATRQGPRLASWQRRRVLEFIEANLAAQIRNKALAALVE